MVDRDRGHGSPVSEPPPQTLAPGWRARTPRAGHQRASQDREPPPLAESTALSRAASLSSSFRLAPGSIYCIIRANSDGGDIGPVVHLESMAFDPSPVDSIARVWRA